MKNIHPKSLLLWACCILCACSGLHAQAPPLHWAQQYGGSSDDVPFVIKPTSDGGTIVGGYTTSKDGDVHSLASREYWDLWVVKLDACGNIRWQQTLGGKGYESARDVMETADGGYLILGETNSTDGGVAAGFGGTKDIWLLKLDANGNLSWQKRMGGSGLDIGNQLYLLNDGNYLIAATSSSNDGIITGNHGTGGYTDGVLIKIDPSGNVLWSKCYGGSKNEELLDIEVINDKIYVAGYANSTDGDIPANQKNYDVWLLTVDQQGNKLSSNIYGGSQNDVAYSMTRGYNNTLTLAGYTTSSDGDVTNAKGDQDYWVLNVGADGKLNWQQTFGGTDADYANYIFTDVDGGYLAGGIAYSKDVDVSGAKGDGDFWLVKLDAGGQLLWKQSYGGSESDYLRAMCFRPASREYYLAGDSRSDDGDFTDNNGETDFAIIKLKLTDTLTRDTTVCNVASFNMPPVMLKDACGNDSLLLIYRPLPLANAFDGMARLDTIFDGQHITLPSSSKGTINWSPATSLSCNNCASPVASPRETTVYTATIQLHECNASDQFKVVVLKDALVFLPNAFTPNGDGVNDWFGPAGKVPADYQMQIYNRYGELVFRSSSINNRWDGRYKGALQPTNTFIYVISYKDMQNQPVVKKGTFTLIH